ncbi:MAG: hypothetical protein ACI9G1_003422 [Pirellulaceae bacterium]|jgi:hypothetical protein
MKNMVASCETNLVTGISHVIPIMPDEGVVNPQKSNHDVLHVEKTPESVAAD